MKQKEPRKNLGSFCFIDQPELSIWDSYTLL